MNMEDSQGNLWIRCLESSEVMSMFDGESITHFTEPTGVS